MPSNQNPLGALPARFRRQRLLIIGCGDIGLRVARGLRSRLQVLAHSEIPETHTIRIGPILKGAA